MFPGSSHQHRSAIETDCPGVQRICIRGFANRSDRCAANSCLKTLATLVRRLRKYTKLPVAVGFGISTSEQV